MRIFQTGLNDNVEISPFLAEKIILTNKFTFSVMLSLWFYVFVYFWINQAALAIGIFSATIILLGVYWANINQKFLLSRHILMITCNVLLVFIDTYFQFHVNVETYFLPASLAGFLLFDISEIFYIALSIFWPICLWFTPRFFELKLPIVSPSLSPEQFQFLYYTNYIGAYALTAYLVYTFFSSLVNFQKRLVVSNKFVALGEMSSGIAHEINNPLAIISGKTSVLLRKIDLGTATNEVLIKDLKKIENTAERISKIVRGLKNFSRSGENDPMSLVKFSDVIEDVMNLCQDKLANQKISLVVPQKMEALIDCRQHEIAQVILNLLNNSADAICEMEQPWIKIEALTSNHRVQISVTDSGPGIPPQVVQKMMDPFFTTKAIGKGTGLGLSISKGIIENHGGHFYYDAKAANTRFVIDLPQAKDPSQT